MVIIYHSKDLDGFTSAAICNRKYPDAKLIGFDYGQKLPMDEIPMGEPVIMVDVSLPMQDMAHLSIHSGHQMTWIDHHISVINEFKNYQDPDLQAITAVLENGIAACEGAWKYLFPDESMPTAVKLLGEYDTWRNQDREKWDNEILPFQFGMRAICNSAESFPAELLMPDTNNTDMEHVSVFETHWYVHRTEVINEIIRNGKSILKYQAQTNEFICKRAAFEHTFKGLRAICLNGGGFNSDVFKSVYDPFKHDIMMPFQFNGKFWTISLYSTKPEINCSEIAKSMGGGGHKAAAGFQVNNIREIFEFMP